MAPSNKISIEKLNELIGTPKCAVIIDVRIDDDFADDPRMVPSAIRYPFDDVESCAERFCNRSVIIYCQKGLKISQGAAAILRNMDINASVLEGGHFAWRGAGLPMISTEIFKPKSPFEPTRWVTYSRPKIDRVACSWLINRFIDPYAKFLFVSQSQVSNVAERFNAIPFGVDGTLLGHEDDLCTFDAMLNVFGIETQALKTMAEIIRGADKGKYDLTREVHGLLALSLGLSRVYRNDEKRIEAGMVMYDALYRWARDEQDERYSSQES